MTESTELGDNMIRSMTAFARADAATPWGELVWEVRSVNHRFLEIAVRMPEALRSLEIKVRERVQTTLSRGKIDCSLRHASAGAATGGLTLNREYARQVLSLAQEIEAMTPAHAAFNALDVLRMPGVLHEPPVDLDALAATVIETLDQGLRQLVQAREREGDRLRAALLQRLDAMAPLVTLIRARMPVVVDGLRMKLRDKLNDLGADFDPMRLEQELVLATQKLDVDEELDRLTGHIDEVRVSLKSTGPVGRKLDFLMQEFNREANTLATKSTDDQVTKAALAMKVLIEQMREQVQNIE